MKTEKQVIPIRRRSRQWLLAVGVLLVGGVAVTSCADKYDLDEKTPDGWGASIYSWLSDQGNFTNTVRMIEDLGYRETLARTGSKTLFVADDAAYERFYQNNSWGVKSYSQLSESQKKLLLFGSMMDNSMQLNTLASVQGNPPLEGQAMRRLSSTSPYDSVAILTKDKMPDNPYWAYYREQDKPIVCMTDNSDVTLVQFIEKQLVNNQITNEDYNFIYNNTTNRQAGDASINGVQVANPNVKCSNGFIHVMSEVITPLPNMAELIRQKPVASQFNKLLERFCAPYPDTNPQGEGSVTRRYNVQYGASVDTVFQKRFFSEKSQEGRPVNLTPRRGPVPAQLKYDPEWNAYYTGLNDQEGNVVLQRDMALMMVPSDEALDDYWNNGAGKVLRDYYGSWDNVPDKVVSALINNNMHESFVSSVPSKFSSILNKDNDPMGVEVSHIDSVWLGCNGAVYLTNRVYSPNDYVSVSFPAMINEAMNILYWGIEQCQYNVYLNSLNSYYSFFIPTNNSLLEYIDPCSYGMTRTRLFRFHYDPKKANKQDQVWASMWYYDPATGEVGDSIPEVPDYNMIRNRLKEIIETHLVVGNVEDGHEFYRTKGGTEIRVKNTQLGAAGMTVEGSYQINESQQPLKVKEIYDQTNGGNGKSYILDGQPIMSTRKTVYDVLSEHDEFSSFRDLLLGSGVLETLHNKRNATAGQNISSFNTYHYTVYVPTNESIKALQDAGKLSSWEKVEQYEEAGNLSAKTRDSLQIVQFVKYHIQDYALFIGAQPDEADYETSAIDPDTERFYRLTAKLTDTGIELTDKASKDARRGVSAHVVTSNPQLYNLVAREYQYDSSNAQNARNLETTSSAVIHLIDNPLLISNQ